MQTRLITTESELLGLKDSWNELVRKNPETDLPFYSWDWFYASWRHFGQPEGRSLFVVAVEEEKRLSGLLPLVTGSRTSSGISYRTLEFCNAGMNPRNSAYFDPARAESVFRAIAGRFWAERTSWDMLELSNVSESSSFHGFLVDGANEPFHGVIRTKGLTSPFIDLPETLDEYLGALDKKTRYNIKRHVRKFEESGEEPEIRLYRRPEESAEALGHLLEVRRNSWKGAYRNSQTPRFYETVLPNLFRCDAAIVVVVLLGRQPIGAAFRLIGNGVCYGFGTDFDLRYKVYAPGTLMFYYLLEDLIRRGGTGFDFCGDDYGYKNQYSNGIRRHSTFQIFHAGWKSRFVFSAKTFWLPLLRKLLRKPAPDDVIAVEKR